MNKLRKINTTKLRKLKKNILTRQKKYSKSWNKYKSNRCHIILYILLRNRHLRFTKKQFLVQKKKSCMLINIYSFHVCVLTLRKEKEMGITKPKQRLTSRCELYPLIVMVDTTEYIYINWEHLALVRFYLVFMHKLERGCSSFSWVRKNSHRL